MAANAHFLVVSYDNAVSVAWMIGLSIIVLALIAMNPEKKKKSPWDKK
jgi:hypothetical protein